MTIGVICSSLFEIEPWLRHINADKVVRKARYDFHIGNIDRVKIVAVVCGICKTNAAIVTQILIDAFSCNTVINTGVAGGISPQVELNEVVVSEECMYWDIESKNLTQYCPYIEKDHFAADEKLLSAARELAADSPDVHFGRIATGEVFVKDGQRIREKTGALCVDMESGSVAHTCYVNGIPFLTVRAISDYADDRAQESFHKNRAAAAQKATDFTAALIQFFEERY